VQQTSLKDAKASKKKNSSRGGRFLFEEGVSYVRSPKNWERPCDRLGPLKSLRWLGVGGVDENQGKTRKRAPPLAKKNRKKENPIAKRVV